MRSCVLYLPPAVSGASQATAAPCPGESDLAQASGLQKVVLACFVAPRRAAASSGLRS